MGRNCGQQPGGLTDGFEWREKAQKPPSSLQKTACSFHDFGVASPKRQKRKVQQTRMVTGLFGGELGIRTLGPFRDTAFRVLHLRPLGQLSICQSENRSHNFWKELTERTAKYSVFRTAGARRNTRFLADKTDTFSKIFESVPL